MSNRVVLKFLTASPEVRPIPTLSWIIIQLCTPNKVNSKFGEYKRPQLPEVNPAWVCDQRAVGFAALLRKLQQIRETNKGFQYNSPNNIFIYVEGSCNLRFDAINKISSGIRLISSCRAPRSHLTRVHLCSLIHNEITLGC